MRAARSGPMGCPNSRSSAFRSPTTLRSTTRFGRSRSCASASGSTSIARASGVRLRRSPRAKWRPAQSASTSIKYKVQMFVVSAGMASVAGSLGSHYLRAMDPNVYGFAYSLNLLTGVIIGGLTSVWGGALGATVITGLREAPAQPVAAAVGIGDHGRPDRDRAARVSGGLAGAIGTLFDRVAGRGRKGHEVSVAPDPSALARAAEIPAAGDAIARRARRVARIRQPARRQRCQLCGRARVDHRADRAERRRQDHVVQPDRRLSAARWRYRPLPRRADRNIAAGRDRAARDRAHVPEPAAVRQHDGARKTSCAAGIG